MSCGTDSRYCRSPTDVSTHSIGKVKTFQHHHTHLGPRLRSVLQSGAGVGRGGEERLAFASAFPCVDGRLNVEFQWAEMLEGCKGNKTQKKRT